MRVLCKTFGAAARATALLARAILLPPPPPGRSGNHYYPVFDVFNEAVDYNFAPRGLIWGIEMLMRIPLAIARTRKMFGIIRGDLNWTFFFLTTLGVIFFGGRRLSCEADVFVKVLIFKVIRSNQLPRFVRIIH